MPNDSDHGGYRRPSRPAPASGPGAKSQRTDGGPSKMDITGEPYGQNDFREIQSGAPLGSPAGPSAAVAPAGVDTSGLTPLDAPSARPGEPVTDGAALGPGAGAEAIGADRATVDPQDAERLRGYLPALIELANRPDSTVELRNYVRTVRALVR